MALVVTDKGVVPDSHALQLDNGGYRATMQHSCEFSENCTEAVRDQTLLDMIAAVAVGMYDIHPVLRKPDFDDHQCVRITPKITSLRGGTTELEYRRKGATFPPETDPLLEVGATLTSAETNEDKNGDVIIVSHTPTTMTTAETHGEYPDTDDNIIVSGVTVPILIPTHTLRFSHSSSSSPEADAMAYVGMVNSAYWHGGDAKTWLCMSITGRSTDNGATYQVQYEFGWRPYSDNVQGWEARVYLIDKSTGKPFKNLVEDTGKKWVEIYNATAFGGLPV